MQISARADYAVRAILGIAAAAPGPAKTSDLATAQDIPASFLLGILPDLRRARLVHSQRGTDGGYRLARPASTITLGDVLRASMGELTTVRGLPADRLDYQGAAAGLGSVWLSVATAITGVVDQTTLEDLLHRAEPTRR